MKLENHISWVVTGALILGVALGLTVGVLGARHEFTTLGRAFVVTLYLVGIVALLYFNYGIWKKLKTKKYEKEFRRPSGETLKIGDTWKPIEKVEKRKMSSHVTLVVFLLGTALALLTMGVLGWISTWVAMVWVFFCLGILLTDRYWLEVVLVEKYLKVEKLKDRDCQGCGWSERLVLIPDYTGKNPVKIFWCPRCLQLRVEYDEKTFIELEKTKPPTDYQVEPSPDLTG